MGKKKEEPKIVIDEKAYKLEDLTDEQRRAVDHIADLDRKIATTTFNLDQLSFGKQAFVNALSESLNTKENNDA